MNFGGDHLHRATGTNKNASTTWLSWGQKPAHVRMYLTFRAFLHIFLGVSLAAQWLGLHASNAGGAGLIPVWGTRIPLAA